MRIMRMPSRVLAPSSFLLCSRRSFPSSQCLGVLGVLGPEQLQFPPFCGS